MESIDRRRALRRALGLAGGAVAAGAGLAARADSAATIDARVRRALEELRATVPGSADLLALAKGVLVMPEILEGGLIVGGAYGEGALLVGDQTVGYYSLAAASLGLQLGVQSSRQALLFMTDDALERFRRADGWQAGLDAQVTVPGDGLATFVNTTAQPAPVIAIVFGQDGLMAGAAVEGAKYSRIER